MGICFGRKKNDRYALIQTQIKNTVREQEDIKEQEELGIKIQSVNEEEITLKLINQSQQLLSIPQIEQEIQPVKKEKKRKRKIKNENYLKQIEYNIQIKSIILEEEEDQTNCQYNITLSAEYMSYTHFVNCKGMIINHPKKTLQIVPNTFEEAAKHARFSPFFQNDFYFNINADPLHNTNYFEKLLNVERQMAADTTIRKQPTKKFSRRSSSVYDEFSSPSPQRKKQNQIKNQYISELLEVVQVFDLETQPRFQQILFALILREVVPILKDYFVYIEELMFLFDRQPRLEQLNIHRIAIFYENLDYNLHDLVVYLKHESLQLSFLCYLKFARDLVQIFYYCYQCHCYRINFTMSTIFFTKRQKKFKVQPFCRLATLIPFEGDPEQHLKTVSEQKLKFFLRSFKKDLGALCDIILYMKNLEKPLEDLQAARKKQKQNKSTDYMEHAEGILDPENEKLLLEIVRISFGEITLANIDQILKDMLDIDTSLLALIAEWELKEDLANKQDELFAQKNESINSDDSKDIIGEIHNFDLGVQMNSLPEFNKKQKIPQLKNQYKELLYSSLFMNHRFQQNSIAFLSNKSDTLHFVYGQILKSFEDVNFNESDYQLQIQRQRQQLECCINQIIEHPLDNQDPFHYYVLLFLLSLCPDRPFSLILQLQRLIEQQQQIKKAQIKPKLKPNHALGGVIELKKVVVLQILFTENMVQRNNYSQAIHLMQKTISLQQKQHQYNTLLYAYCLYLNGLICAKTMQPISAMLNLEMCKQLYDMYFPHSLTIKSKQNQSENEQNSQKCYSSEKISLQFKQVENLAALNQSTLEFKLGQIYFQLNDSENALKCFRNGQRMREKRYDMFSDQVIEIVLETLKVYAEQEESGAVAKLCLEINQKMNKRYKEKFVFQTKNVAILQLIMAVIYENNGVLVSSIRYYSRAQKTFLASKSSNYVRQLYISDKIKLVISMIKAIAHSTVSLGKQQNNNIGNLKGLITISDILKPFFSNSYHQKSKQIHLANQKIASPIIMGNGFLKNGELQEAINRYEFVHKIFSKHRIDENYGIILEKLGLISIYQKKFDKGINYINLAIEIHERYLEFPLRQLSILRMNLYILFHFAYQRNQRQILDQFDEIEKLIDQIHYEMHWNLTPVSSTRLNKFKVISAKLGSKALYTLQDLIGTIDLYYIIKKQLYENFKDPEKLQELALVYAQKKLIQLSQKQRQLWLDKRSQCQIGQLAKVYVIKRKRVLSVNSTDKNNTKLGITQNTTAMEQTIEKLVDSQIQIDDSVQPHKILIDLRTAEEILEDQERLQQQKLLEQRRLAQQRKLRVSSQIITEEIQLNPTRKSSNLNYSQMKQILTGKVEEKQNQESQKLQQNISSPQLKPLKIKGRQQKSFSQPGIEQKQSAIKVEDEQEKRVEQTISSFQYKRKRTISQQSISKYKINPFEKVLNKKK